MDTIDKNYLHNMYNATSSESKNGDLESYESWLERQLLKRIHHREHKTLLPLYGIKSLIEYAELGYEVSFTTIYGKSGIKMIQRQTGAMCEQIINYDTLDLDRLNYVLVFMYHEIQKTEKYTKKTP